MRPRVLTVSAFGPYAGLERIDFTPFFDRGVLLIEGPTGAGKTAILDAISYALFGVVPGARDQARGELRSNWADPQTNCFVELELELGGRVLRAFRSPEQTRLKKRGQGTTKQHAEARLVEVVGGLESPLCASRVGDVDAKVGELLGLNAEQWKQVMILPQGEFRRFLLATSSEKESLLEQLFATREYRDVADRLREAQARLEQRAGDANRSAGELLAQRGVQSVDELEARRITLAERLVELTCVADGSAARAEAAQRASAEATELAARFAERDRLWTEAETLAGEAPRMEAERALLTAAERAQPLAAGFARVAQAMDARARCAAQLVGHEVEHAAAASEAVAVGQAAGKLGGHKERLVVLAGEEAAAAQLEVVEVEAQAARRKLTVAEREHGQRVTAAEVAGRTRDAVRLRLEALDVERVAAEARGQAAGELGVRAERAADEARRRAALVVAEAGAADARRKAERARVAGEAARQRAVAAEQAFVAGKAAREAGLAAELALRLVAGEACLVCGSADHPAPAAPGIDAVSRGALAELEAGAAERRRLAGDAERLAAELAVAARAAGERAAEQRTALGSLADLAPEAVHAEAIRLAGEHEAAQAAARRAVSLRLDREKGARALTDAEAALAAAGEQVGTAALAVVDARARLDEIARRLSELGGACAPLDVHDVVDAGRARGAAGDARASSDQPARPASARARRAALAEERAGLEREVARLERLAAASSARVTTANKLVEAGRARLAEDELRVGEATADLERDARALAFADAAEARRAQLGGERVTELRRVLTAWDRRVSSIHERLATLAGLSALSPPDAPGLALAAREAHAMARQAGEDLGHARASLGELDRTLALLRQHLATYADIDQQLRVFGRLARVVGGDNQRNMSLQRFVLASRMDEVTIAASERLARMSRGRYRLRRTDEVRHGNRGAGLDLVVDDAHTGVPRSVQSLSGGEMFLSSLSLAMGLADVVQAHAGGVRLDSLFVDEGFGTLDDETLDVVVRTLEDLRIGGRLVGVISHVAELRERLTARLSVVKGTRGSTTRTVV